MPSVDKVKKVAEYFGVSVDSLLEDGPSPAGQPSGYSIAYQTKDGKPLSAEGLRRVQEYIDLIALQEAQKGEAGEE